MAIPMGQRNDWLILKSSFKVSHSAHVTNLGVRCQDGVAHIAELDLTQYVATDRVNETRRQILQQVYEHVVKQLALLELDKT